MTSAAGTTRTTKTYNAAQIQLMRDNVEAYRALGFSVIPLKWGQKQPALNSWTEYQTRSVTDEEIQGWFFANDDDTLYGIAAVLGPSSGYLILIDIDGPEGQELFEKKLAELGYCNNLRGSILHGFMNRSGSHRGFHILLRVSVPLYQKYAECLHCKKLWAGKNHNGIEVMGQGFLAILSPSLHPDGWQYAWNGKPPSTLQSEKELKDLWAMFGWDLAKEKKILKKNPGITSLNGFGDEVQQEGLETKDISETEAANWLAALEKNSRYSEGQRHFIILRLAGWLRINGYHQKSALWFTAVICEKFGDKELDERLRTINDVYDNPIEKISRGWGLNDIV